MKHVLSIKQFTKSDIEEFGARADSHALQPNYKPLDGKILANLFYEPSTRTSSSFYSAMVRLGGHVIPINEVAYSSVAKGETLLDTIRTMQCYADVIVLRHPDVGAASLAASVATVPIINAGDGIGEHPTQGLLDFYTIRKELGTVNGLHVVMMGDLSHGRTVKSLAALLRNYDVRISWVSPDALRIPESYVRSGEIETNSLDDVIANADVLYVTRVQRERHKVYRHRLRSLIAMASKRLGLDGKTVTSADLSYGVTPENMAWAKGSMLLMHPLPRMGEIPFELDADPRAAYFRQMQYGLYMRMGILSYVFDK